MTSSLISRPSIWLTVPCLTLAALCSVAAPRRALEINDFDRLLAVKTPCARKTSAAITNASGDIGSYDWSPDATRLVLSMSPGDEASGSAKTPKPIVIDRLHFKEDKEGYLTAVSRPQLYVLDLASKKLAPLTADAHFEDSSPIWSPDGKTIAFFSNRTTDPDRSGTQELYLIEPRTGAAPRKLAEFYTMLRKLSAHNDALMAELSLGAVEDIAFPSRDGTMIHGMMSSPSGIAPGEPTRRSCGYMEVLMDRIRMG